MEDAELLEIKDRAWERFSTIPGVHAVGIGSKVVAGTRTPEPAIVVFVERKKDLEDLDVSDVVPPTIEGVKTDVVEMARPRQLAANPNLARNIELLPAVPPPPLGNGARITLISDGGNPPRLGFVVVVTVTLTRLAPGPPVGSVKEIRAAVYSNGRLTLNQLALKLETGLGFSSVERPLEAHATMDRPEVVASRECCVRCLGGLLHPGHGLRQIYRRSPAWRHPHSGRPERRIGHAGLSCHHRPDSR